MGAGGLTGVDISNVPGWLWQGALAFALAYLIAFIWYAVLARYAERDPTLAPIVARDGMAAVLGRESGLLISAHLNSIAATYNNLASMGNRPFVGEAGGGELQQIVSLVETYTHLELAASRGREGQHVVQEDLVVTLAGREIPIGALLILVGGLFRWIPIPSRTRYEDALIRVSLLSSGDRTQLIVHRRKQLFSRAEVGVEGEAVRVERVVLIHEAQTTTLAEFSDLLRNAAFMILQVYTGNPSASQWHRRRFFVDGLNHLDRYLRSGNTEAIAAAEQAFEQAVGSGLDRPDHEVLYLHASLLMRRRHADHIRLAIDELNQALDLADKAIKDAEKDLEKIDSTDTVRLKAKEDERTRIVKLQALTHSALSFCHSQRVHRLAQDRDQATKDARMHADRAVELWPKGKDGLVHPLALSRRFLAFVVDEGTPEPASRRKTAERYEKAFPDVLEAIRQQPNNWTLHNMLGWVLTKLVEWDESVALGVFEEGANAAVIAERHLKLAYELNANRLSASNLCLLYSAPYFRDVRMATSEHERERLRRRYRRWSRYYGKKALLLDPTYVNGHRDLAVSLVRYGDRGVNGEAHWLFTRSLLLAESPEKTESLIDDLQAELAACEVPEDQRRAWATLEPHLFDPRTEST